MQRRNTPNTLRKRSSNEPSSDASCSVSGRPNETPNWHMHECNVRQNGSVIVESKRNNSDRDEKRSGSVRWMSLPRCRNGSKQRWTVTCVSWLSKSNSLTPNDVSWQRRGKWRHSWRSRIEPIDLLFKRSESRTWQRRCDGLNLNSTKLKFNVPSTWPRSSNDSVNGHCSRKKKRLTRKKNEFSN